MMIRRTSLCEGSTAIYNISIIILFYVDKILFNTVRVLNSGFSWAILFHKDSVADITLVYVREHPSGTRNSSLETIQNSILKFTMSFAPHVLFSFTLEKFSIKQELRSVRFITLPSGLCSPASICLWATRSLCHCVQSDVAHCLYRYYHWNYSKLIRIEHL